MLHNFQSDNHRFVWMKGPSFFVIWSLKVTPCSNYMIDHRRRITHYRIWHISNVNKTHLGYEAELYTKHSWWFENGLRGKTNSVKLFVFWFVHNMYETRRETQPKTVSSDKAPPSACLPKSSVTSLSAATHYQNYKRTVSNRTNNFLEYLVGRSFISCLQLL